MEATYEMGINISEAREVERIYQQVVDQEFEVSSLNPEENKPLSQEYGHAIVLNGKFFSEISADDLFYKILDAKNFRNSEELVMIVDENNEIVGKATRAEMREQNLWHRASFVFVENINEEFICQIRADTKEWCPGHIDVATGGIMGYDETNEENAQRELKEEIGIDWPLEDLKLLGQFKYDDKIRCWGNIYHVKLKNEGKDLKLQREEVKGVFYLKKDQILDMIEKQDFAHDSKAAFMEYLKLI